jgi:hypothetical protein
VALLPMCRGTSHALVGEVAQSSEERRVSVQYILAWLLGVPLVLVVLLWLLGVLG